MWNGKKEEEQGGEPFWVEQKDGTMSLQIVDFYQIVMIKKPWNCLIQLLILIL